MTAAVRQPVVLVFLRPGERLALESIDLGAARAELRGLGAVLLAISDEGAWCLAPDDEPRLLGAGEVPSVAGGIALSRAAYDIPAEAGTAVLVVDGDRTIRFAHAAADAEAPSTLALVVRALAAAGSALASEIARAARFEPSRRELVIASLVAALSLLLVEGGAAAARPGAGAGGGNRGSGERAVTLNVNGVARTVRIDPRVTLLDALRERLGLPGTKKGCDQGQCGACTVLLDGRRVNACLMLAVMAEGQPIVTIEGLEHFDRLHPLQAAFVADDGFQCGYCTAGQIMSAAGMLAEGHAHTDDEVREQMSGNLCRCGAYPNVVAAIQRARKET